MTKTQKLYDALIKGNGKTIQKVSPEVRRNIAPNGLRLVLANALQASGDHTVNASTVLPWLFAALGVPPALTGLLVPIRESGSMLPQAALTPLVLRVRYRKYVFVAGALIQAIAVAVMVTTAALGQGLTAGWIIIAALAVFSFGRCLCSIASKDVLGRTIPKGQRGQINGLATTAAGLVAITLGLAVRGLGGDDLSAPQLAWLLGFGALLWVAVAGIYYTVREPAPAPKSPAPRPSEPQNSAAQTKTQTEPTRGNWFTQAVRLIQQDKAFRHFVTVRSLLLVSSLSPPFIVTLSIQSGAGSLAGLGGFIIAAGLASLLGGRLFGGLADRSSKRLMSLGAGIASAVIVLTVVLAAIPGMLEEHWGTELFFIAVYFSLTLMHTGVRVGRKTYVVDMAEGNQRTTYVAVSNSVMGLVLLVVGGVSSLLAIGHIFWALIFLSVMGLIGVFAGARLPDVSEK